MKLRDRAIVQDSKADQSSHREDNSNVDTKYILSHFLARFYILTWFFYLVLRSKKLLGKITDHDYEQAYHKARSKRCDGTGNWLKNCLEFQDWLRDSTSGLWINGFGE